MYERHVVPAIQYEDVKDLETRFRKYKTADERDRIFEALQEHKPDPSMVRVTLTITAEPVPTQGSFFGKEENVSTRSDQQSDGVGTSS